MEKKRGQLIVISGPSGVGKGTVCKVLLSRNPNMRFSVSATTRAIRPGEIEGVHYFYITQAEFDAMIERDEFLEYMKVFGMNSYGTPKAFVEEQRSQGMDIVLDIDVQGGMRVKEVAPDAIMIFIAPPDQEELKARLVGRGTETPEAIERRLATASGELACIPLYDYIVLNDEVEKAAAAIEAIVAAERCRVTRNGELIEKLQQR